MSSSSSFKRHLQKVIKHFGRTPLLAASAPGRADFLNTHQDYKGLPVVPIGVSLRTYAFALEWTEGLIIESLNLKEEDADCRNTHLAYEDRFPLRDVELRGGGWFGDYFRAVLRALAEEDLSLDRGLRCCVSSDVPVASGLGSSAALEVSFLKLLDACYGFNLTRRELAEIAYRAEHDEMRIPCGRLDQYGSAFGGIVKLETRPPYSVEEMPLPRLDLVIMDSGIRHSTADIHPKRQSEIDEGLRALMRSDDLPISLKEKLGHRYFEPRWEEIEEEEITQYLESVKKVCVKRILFTLRMEGLTQLAFKIIREETFSEADKRVINIHSMSIDPGDKITALGQIVNRQHELLRDLYDLSTPELERIRDASLSSGAYGVKISGAGLGGALIALGKNEDLQKIMEAGLEAGAAKCWITSIDSGAKIETL